MRLLILLLCIVFLISVIFLGLSYSSPFLMSNSKSSQTIQNASLYFKPSTVYSSCRNSTETVEIYLNSGTNSATGAQIELTYNPSIASNVTIIPSQNNFFGKAADFSVALNEMRSEYGRVSYAVNKTKQLDTKGNKSLALLTFTLNATASNSSRISFLNKSAVYSNSSRASILENTVPLLIQCE